VHSRFRAAGANCLERIRRFLAYGNAYFASRRAQYRLDPAPYGLADCRRRIQWEFFLGTKRARRNSLRKVNLLINLLISFRDALQKEIALIEKAARDILGSGGPL